MPVPIAFSKALKKFGNKDIETMYLQRTPVGTGLIKLMDVISGGKFEKNMAVGGYDKLFHLSLIMELNDGKRIMTDKTDELQITAKPKNEKGGERIALPFKGKLTLNEMLTNTRNLMGAKWFVYNAKTANCQNYIWSILKSNKLTTPENDKFVNQDTDVLFQDTGVLKEVSAFLTDAGRISKTVLAQSVKKSYSELGDFMRANRGSKAVSFARRQLDENAGVEGAKLLEAIGDDILRLNITKLGNDLQTADSHKIVEDRIYAEIVKKTNVKTADAVRKIYNIPAVKKRVIEAYDPVEMAKSTIKDVEKAGNAIGKLFKPKKKRKRVTTPPAEEESIQKPKPTVSTIDREQAITFI